MTVPELIDQLTDLVHLQANIIRGLSFALLQAGIDPGLDSLIDEAERKRGETCDDS